MNKDLFDQIPAEEQPMASTISSMVENMQPSPAFQWELESQLMDKAAPTQPVQRWFTKIMVPAGWLVAAFIGVLLLNSLFRSLVSQPPPAAAPMPTQEVSFADRVRSGDICIGPLAVGHGFSVFLTNPEKTAFAAVDAGDPSGELRSFTWSADGKQLAILSNSMGSGNIYITDPHGTESQPVLPIGEADYLLDASWSRNGELFVAWSGQNNSVVYLIEADGSGVVRKPLGMQSLSMPQFSPDNQSIVFLGADADSYGLFEVKLNEEQIRMISPQVEDETGFAFSPEGLRLAYMEIDRDAGETRLVAEDLVTNSKLVLGTLPIPTGSGASIPETANLSWSSDGQSLVFDFGRNAVDRAIYLAYADGSGLIKVVEEAYAPSISADGKCLAYISNNQVFLLDSTSVSANSTVATPILLADLPSGRGPANTKQDQLQWSPAATP